MRQQRPFVVEIKQKRGLVKRPQSIWGGIDLVAITSDIAKAKADGVISEATRRPIFLEDVRSPPVLITGDAGSDPEYMNMLDASLPQPPTAEEEPVPDGSKAPS
ncbi:Uncharacterized protein MLTONO_p0047 (plasmid) [Mesorhizobium loti]|uniref:hypothetical protein n=1 Tax=Mesorhizobium TaxID=68287 RepID=UPI000306ED8E|nr:MULTISPECIES: hypothetical protein [Mesorhizobium]BAV52517.1 Uncharacterized protein MLTONO_p0047 [Mesorhizobium loti]BCH05129.1 hypothetical protein MesoLj131b_71280 [Mesorhizobium sp. 131-2-5]